MSKPTYTEVLRTIEGRLSVIETTTQYQENHLSNIDQHLNKLNERTNKAEITGAENKTSINRLYWIIGGICSLAAIVTPIVVIIV